VTIITGIITHYPMIVDNHYWNYYTLPNDSVNQKSKQPRWKCKSNTKHYIFRVSSQL